MFTFARTAAWATPATVRVRLFEAHPGLQSIQILGPFTLKGYDSSNKIGMNETRCGDSSGKSNKCHHGLKLDGAWLVLDTSDSSSAKVRAKALQLSGCGGQPITVFAGGQERRYYGDLNCLSRQTATRTRELIVINEVPIQEYVIDVVGSETLAGWPSEALKAQAVLTQTRLAKHDWRQELGDSTQGEAYLGANYERPGIRKAVLSAWGNILLYKGQPATVFYHAACAGKTSKGSDIFGRPAANFPYLASVPCSYCKDSPFWKHTCTSIAADKFKHEFGDKVPRVDRTDSAGRPLSLTLFFGNRVQEISGYQFWIRLGQTFGWDKAPGTRYQLEQLNNNVRVRSTGAGHGVGLCEWGAAGLSRAGWTYKRILQYYFPGTTLKL